MPTRPVQISIDQDLLQRLDADPETKQKGRSALIAAAVELYLRAKQRRDTEARIAAAYSGQAAAMAEEVSDFIDAQAWPED